jgi:hypothetical protein
MNLTFEYEGKLYQIELNAEQITRYEKYNVVEADVLIADKKFVRELLTQYGLEDDTKSRQLWDKCYELTVTLSMQVKYFHQLVELIQN